MVGEPLEPTRPLAQHPNRALIEVDPASGLRDFEQLDDLARTCGMTLEADHEMPVNNRLLVWRKGK